jgi:hypothetical protein
MNPKDALGVKKIPQSVVSQAVMREVGLGMLEGSLKYGRHNYRVSKVLGSVYYDAARRHIDSWWEGEDLDPDSGLSHITKAICSLVVLRDAMIVGQMSDDRPPKVPLSHTAGLEEQLKVLLAKYLNPKPPFLEGDQHD